MSYSGSRCRSVSFSLPDSLLFNDCHPHSFSALIWTSVVNITEDHTKRVCGVNMQKVRVESGVIVRRLYAFDIKSGLNNFYAQQSNNWAHQCMKCFYKFFTDIFNYIYMFFKKWTDFNSQRRSVPSKTLNVNEHGQMHCSVSYPRGNGRKREHHMGTNTVLFHNTLVWTQRQLCNSADHGVL